MSSDEPVAKLSRDTVLKRLETLPGWEVNFERQRLVRSWKMRDFASAMQFLNRVAEIAEQLGHHPDLHLERYRHVRIEIWTHTADGLTDKDFLLASHINGLEEVK
jgi:4a-hydroxytetrahydrobiopterin dehydratase